MRLLADNGAEDWSPLEFGTLRELKPKYSCPKGTEASKIS